MKKTITAMVMVFTVFALAITNAAANGEHDFTEAKALVEGKVACSQLTDEQLEEIGDYLMEQIHPGEAHELMDKMMGGEGSESLRLMHIAMAKRLYCNDLTDSVNYGMMGYGMMGSGLGRNLNYGNGGMMSMMGGMTGGSFGYGMMGNYGYWGFWNFLSVVLVIGLIALVYLWVIKLWREVFGKKSSK